MTSRIPAGSADGFTLVETLVSLTIAALAIAALLQLFGSTGETTLRNKNRSLAELHLSSLIAQTEILVTETTRDIAGEFSGDYRWQIRSRPLGPEIASRGGVIGREILYTVSWREGRRTRELSLTAERILPR